MPAGDPYCEIHGQNPCSCNNLSLNCTCKNPCYFHNPPTQTEPIFCTHANEVPLKCSCKEGCYCQGHTCKNTDYTPTKEDNKKGRDYFKLKSEVVNVYFANHAPIYNFVIEYYPQATGGSFVGYSLDNKKKYRIQQFECMEQVKQSKSNDEVPF